MFPTSPPPHLPALQQEGAWGPPHRGGGSNPAENQDQEGMWGPKASVSLMGLPSCLAAEPPPFLRNQPFRLHHSTITGPLSGGHEPGSVPGGLRMDLCCRALHPDTGLGSSRWYRCPPVLHMGGLEWRGPSCPPQAGLPTRQELPQGVTRMSRWQDNPSRRGVRQQKWLHERNPPTATLMSPQALGCSWGKGVAGAGELP